MLNNVFEAKTNIFLSFQPILECETLGFQLIFREISDILLKSMISPIFFKRDKSKKYQKFQFLRQINPGNERLSKCRC